MGNRNCMIYPTGSCSYPDAIERTRWQAGQLALWIAENGHDRGAALGLSDLVLDEIVTGGNDGV